MNTFSKKLAWFFSTLMWVGLIYVAVLMFVGQTSTNTYYKDSNNAVQKVMADLNFYQSTNNAPYNDSELYNNKYSSEAYPEQNIYKNVQITYGLTDVPPLERVISTPPPPPVRHSH